MENLILPRSKIMLEGPKKIRNLLPSLHKYIEPDLFSYTRIYDDGGLIDLCNREDVIECLYYDQKKLLEDLPADICPEILEGEYFLTQCYETKNPTLIHCNQSFGMSHILTVSKRGPGYYESFWFGSHQELKFVNFCINNMAQVEAFILQFKNNIHISRLIDKFEADRMNRPISEEIKLRNIEFVMASRNSNKEGFIKNSTLSPEKLKLRPRSRIPLQSRSPELFITKREMDCVYWCVEGKTAEETALILNLSRRTVETHLFNIRQKLGCFNKASLIRKINSLGVFN